jgi:hypothetical protein
MTATWSRVKIGDGGLVTAISIAPDGTMVHRTDSSGASIWNSAANSGAGAWEQMFARSRMPVGTGDLGGGVEEVWTSPSNTNHIWMLKAQQLWKSVDKGQHFTLTTFGAPNPETLEFNGASTTKGLAPFGGTDPINANVVYCSTLGRGLQRSTDGGSTWATIAALSGGLPGRPYNNTTTPSYGTDSTAVTVGTGSKTFSNNSIAFGFPVGVGNIVKVWSASDKTLQMIGAVTASAGTSFTINVDTAFGSGSHSDWVVSPLITAGDQNSCHCGGHRIAFDSSGGTVTAFGQTVTRNVYVHTNDVATWKSTDGGVTWTKITATGTPNVILNWACDPFGVLWVVDGDYDYATAPNIRKFDTGVWSHIVPGNNGGTFAGAATFYCSVAVDVLNSPSKGATKVTFAMGDQLWLVSTVDGGATWWNTGTPSNRVFDSLPGNDVTWLLDYYHANPTAFFGLAGIAYDPISSGKLWLAAEGPWYTTPNTSTSVAIPLHLQARGVEEFIPMQMVCPQSGVLYLSSWDFPFFRTSNFDAYPSVIGGPYGASQGSLSGSLLNGLSLDFNANVMAFVVGDSGGNINNAVNKVAYSLDYGATVSLFPTQPYTGLRACAQIACSNDGQTFVVVPPENEANPKITTNRGTSWADISIPGGFSGQFWGIGAFYLAEAKLIESDKTTGDIYLYCVNDGAGHDPMYKWTKTTGLWTIANANCGFPSAYLLEQLTSVPTHAGHMVMAGGATNCLGWCTANGWATHSTMAGFSWVKTVGYSPPASGHSYHSLMVYGTRSGVTGYWLSQDFDITTGGGTWANVVGPEDLATPKSVVGDLGIPLQFYSWTANGASWYGETVGGGGGGGTPTICARPIRMRFHG